MATIDNLCSDFEYYSILFVKWGAYVRCENVFISDLQNIHFAIDAVSDFARDFAKNDIRHSGRFLLDVHSFIQRVPRPPCDIVESLTL